jgi:hypothetical protein
VRREARALLDLSRDAGLAGEVAGLVTTLDFPRDLIHDAGFAHEARLVVPTILLQHRAIAQA